MKYLVLSEWLNNLTRGRLFYNILLCRPSIVKYYIWINWYCRVMFVYVCICLYMFDISFYVSDKCTTGLLVSVFQQHPREAYVGYHAIGGGGGPWGDFSLCRRRWVARQFTFCWQREGREVTFLSVGGGWVARQFTFCWLIPLLRLIPLLAEGWL